MLKTNFNPHFFPLLIPGFLPYRDFNTCSQCIVLRPCVSLGGMMSLGNCILSGFNAETEMHRCKHTGN